MAAGRTYTASFWAKASANRTINFVAQQMADPFALYMDQTAALTTAWQQYSYTFTPGQADSIFLGFNLAGSTGTVWIDGVSLK